ncbi:RDD family protein [Mucilaginibacter sp. 14171R-50]|uniref:RDD family protein n=1 Tax=Mucilaginibacter sp. 14171R-50 TaxID=2703789 RepID=UPI00138D06A7|nr:RDD family protein [Mucilaginibacter sp. 14171R-50]QHS55550.1 RDD family protein [Mucilaginibacter sp. 14171R-50]
MTEGYYISINDREEGPYTLEELLGMHLELDTMVLSPLGGDWQRASDLPELFDYFEAQGFYFPTEDNLAGFWWRLLAYVIDSVIVSNLLSLVTGDITAPIYKKMLDNTLTKEDMPLFFQVTLMNFLVFAFYNAICEATPLQGSPGKKICRLVVVDTDGRRLSMGRALLRNLSKFLSQIVFLVGYLAILWDDHKQAWHDKIARTYVLVRNR